MLLGTSMGGARPKAVVQDDDGLWVAKFNRADDRWNNTRVEHAMLRLARECGITTAESRIETVGGRDVLLVKRFDREKTAKGYTRARMVSGLTILRADEAPEARQNWSYVILVEELRRIVEDAKKDAKRTLPPRLLQRAHLEHRRSPAQSRDHREGKELEALARLRPDAVSAGEPGAPRPRPRLRRSWAATPMRRTSSRSTLAFCSIAAKPRRSSTT